MILIRSWEQSPCSFQATGGFKISHYKPMVTSSCHSNQRLYWADKLKQCAYSPPYYLFLCSQFHEKKTCIFGVIAGSAFSHFKPIVTSSCHSNQSVYWAENVKNVHNLHPTIYPCCKFHEKRTCSF